jgi:hypothetical protein
MKTVPMEILEVQAAQEREQLHQTASELKTKVRSAREHLDVVSNAREHFGVTALILGVSGLLCGYLVAGKFTSA